MRLPRAGCEYAHMTFTGLPDGVTVQFSVDDGITWHATDGDGQERRILLRGPEYAGDSGSVEVTESCVALVKVTDTPEVVIRETPRIQLV